MIVSRYMDDAADEIKPAQLDAPSDSVPLRYGLPLAVLAGLISSLPFTAGAPHVAWVSLAPIFYLVANALKIRHALLLAVFFCFSWLIPSLWFITPQTFGGYIAVVLFTSCFYIGGLLAVRKLSRVGVFAGIWGVAALWAMIEIARARFPILSFPWLLWGHATWQYPILRQSAELLGVYGLSFLLVAVNASLAFILPGIFSARAFKPPGSKVPIKICGVLVPGLLLACWLFGYGRLNNWEAQMEEGPWIATIQGCTYNKVDRTDEQMATQLKQHIAWHEKAAREAPKGQEPALVCWAETMIPGVWNSDSYGDDFMEAVAKYKKPTLAGVIWLDEADTDISNEYDQRWYNQAIIFDENSKIITTYAKRKLVPFGEYIPLTKTFPVLKRLRSVTLDTFTSGIRPAEIVKISGMQIAMNVCADDLYPELFQESRRLGADVFINISNDAWFRRTSGGLAHLQAASFRALENRIPLIRVTNSGSTVQVDPFGHIQQPLPSDEIGVVRFNVSRMKKAPTWLMYQVFGDLWVGVLFLLIVVGAVAVDFVFSGKRLIKGLQS